MSGMKAMGVEGDNEHAQLLSKPSHGEKLSLVPGGFKGVIYFLCMSSWWFAYSGMMGAMPSVVWPSQIEDIVGTEKKEEYNGYVPAFGAVVSLVITPVAGVLSDRSRSRIGRRKVFILSGSIIAVAFLFCLGYFSNEGGNLWLFIAYTVGLQFGANWAAGPYAGLLPDLVHPSQRGTASGYNGLSQVLGYLAGLAIAGVFTQHNRYWQVYAGLAALFVVFSLPTIIGVRENTRLAETAPPMTFVGFFKSFYLDPKKYRSFYWVMVTRGLEQMGYFTVMPFFQFFLQDVLQVEKPERSASILFVCILVFSVPSSLIAGKLSDKYGRKLLVQLSTGLMALTMGGTICISLFTAELWILIATGAFFGVGYGAFLSVDWALALDSLPPDADAAKDMGIWHIAFVLPQVLAPIMSGIVVTELKARTSMAIAYASVFGMSSLWFTLSAIFVMNVRVQPKPLE